LLNLPLRLWSVQGAIFEISKISNYTTQKNVEKKRFSFDINDGTSEIRVVCFLPVERADIEYEKLIINKVLESLTFLPK
jgi:hypothetical protein